MDRYIYLESLFSQNLKNIVIGNGISSVLPPDVSYLLLQSSNLISLLDKNGLPTSLLFHSGIMRVIFDTV